MALFGKKKPVEHCAICGKERKTGLLRGLFQTEIDGQYVCSDCYGNVDVQQDIRNAMTMDQFKAYVAFREENKKLKERFNTTADIDLGGWDNHVMFDRSNALMCLDRSLDKTIFQRGSLRSFVIREDGSAIFEGSSSGLQKHESIVTNQIRTLESDVARFHRERRMYEERLRRLSPEDREREEKFEPRFTGAEPFQKFYVELYFDHPYWREVTMEIGAPNISDTNPDIARYMSDYHNKYESMSNLAKELMAFSFPGAGTVGAASAAAPVAAPAAVSQADAVDALKRFKELLDMGVITEEEFAAKKRQLLGL